MPSRGPSMKCFSRRALIDLTFPISISSSPTKLTEIQHNYLSPELAQGEPTIRVLHREIRRVLPDARRPRTAIAPGKA